MTDSSELHSRTFAEHLNTTFDVDVGASPPVLLRLTEVNEHTAPPQVEAFSLIFTGPAAPRLPQRTYRVKHEKIGSFDIFMTAIDGNAAGITYESVFNRLRKKT